MINNPAWYDKIMVVVSEAKDALKKILIERVSADAGNACSLDLLNAYLSPERYWR